MAEFLCRNAEILDPQETKCPKHSVGKDDPKVGNPNQWRGLNLLGFALMEVRDGLQPV